VVKPLTRLKGNELWTWQGQQQEAFDELKQRVCSNPILIIPINNAPYQVEVDTSNYAIGGILSQKVNDKWHPVVYMSQALSNTEQNYKVYDKRCLS
jgi:hypothetical protein